MTKKLLCFTFLLVVFLAATAYAQSDDWFGDFANVFGLDLAVLATLSAAVVMGVNFLKDLLKLQGNQILIANGVVCLILSITQHQPDITKIIVGAIAIFVISTGAWSSAKRLAHKVGRLDT